MVQDKGHASCATIIQLEHAAGKAKERAMINFFEDPQPVATLLSGHRSPFNCVADWSSMLAMLQDIDRA